MLPVVVPFTLNKQNDQQANRHAGGQSQNIDQRIRFSFKQVAQSNFENVFKHMLCFQIEG
jgi:hypothetical protein